MLLPEETTQLVAVEAAPDGDFESGQLESDAKTALSALAGDAPRVPATSAASPLVGDGDKFEHAFEPRGIRTRMRKGASEEHPQGDSDRSSKVAKEEEVMQVQGGKVAKEEEVQGGQVQGGKVAKEEEVMQVQHVGKEEEVMQVQHVGGLR
jgi:hypothetical protein